jgi:signal transduction histidine kinase/ligand-binding sensor domain-containing protein
VGSGKAANLMSLAAGMRSWRAAGLFLLLTAYCLLLAAIGVSRSFAQNETQPIQSQPAASPSPAPSPSPSPTPPANLHQWGAITLFHGLPSDRVHAIAQTPDGMLWFATDGGLAKYDGRRTQAITSEQLPAGRILALRVDAAGALWVGTENGAARYLSGAFKKLTESEGKTVTAILIPQKNRALLATENGVILDYQLTEDGRTVGRLLPNQPLQSADKDHPGPLKITGLALLKDTLYAGTQSRGLITIENGEAKEIQSRPRSFFVNTLETDARGHLWAGARGAKDEGALFDQTDPLKPARANASTGPVTAIARGADEDIWVTTDGHGVFHLESGKVTDHFTFEGSGGAMRSDHVYAVFVDREEVVWFGTDKGVCRYDPHAVRTENVGTDAGTNYVRALFRTSHGLLLAGTNSGLFAYEQTNQQWRPIGELGRRIVYAVNEDKNGRVLIATANGLFASTPGNNNAFVRIQAPVPNLPQGDSVRAIASVDGATYVATYGFGVERLRGAQRMLIWPPASADDNQREITALNADAGEHLQIGTANAGVFFFDGQQTTTDVALNQLKGEAVWSILADGAAVWLATGRGLYLYQSGQLKPVVTGVNARTVAISAANDHTKQFWCATVGSGLVKVAVDDQLGALLSRMDIEQGLPSQRVFAVWTERAQNGGENLIVGTNRGVSRYEPGYAAPALWAERVISRRVHTASELTSGLQLDYPQNTLLLDVAANSSRTFPEQFQYAFALYDAAGHVILQKLSHDPRFSMEGLKAGRYRVVARAFTKDLIPSNALSFEFNVARPPFPWTSTALAVLLALALIALAWGYVQNRRIHRTSSELAFANRELAEARVQLANETEAERRRIARDLHDQTLADLRNLMLSVDQLSNGGQRPPANVAQLRQEIESISQEVRRICEDLSPSALENVGLSAALQFALAHAVEHAAPECKFEYRFDCDESLDERMHLPPSTQIQIYRIAQEALSNICRHANAKHVTVHAGVVNGNVFELRIDDDGRGFDANEAKKNSGRGLTNIRARASMIDAEIAWITTEGGGTRFSLRLPDSTNSSPADIRSAQPGSGL